MKTEAKKPEKCNVELTVTLEPAEAAAVVKDVEKAFVREARLPGFRPGKAPIELLRREFAAQMKGEMQNAMLRKHSAAAIKEAVPEAIDITGVKEAVCTAEGGSFTILVDVKPTFKLPTYKGLKISENDTKVTDDQVKEQIERLRTGYAKYEDAKEGDVIADGDFVQIDYAGTVDGKSILEIAPDAKIVAQGTGFWTQVEEGRFLKELLDALKGMKVGETKEGVKAKFDKESAPEPLKGKKAVYNVTVKGFRRRVLPDDKALAEAMKQESFEKIVADIRERMEKQAVENESVRRENEAVELLLKKVDFDVPASVVERARDAYLNELLQRAQYAGLNAEYFEQNRDKILKDATEHAEKQVRLMYVLGAIADAEKIEAKDEEKGKKAIEFVLANAKK